MVTPLIIAHRGASAFRPEHTLEAYELAIELGADFIEPDLVSTKDGVLVARHENELSSTTDVARKFPNRLTTKMIDGDRVTGYFIEDFTLAEVKSLRARERIPKIRPNNTEFDGLWEIPTFEEIIDLVNQKSVEVGRKIGIYPETKHPTFFAKEGQFLGGGSINLSLGKLLIDTLVTKNFTDPNRIFIQSFEFENLLELHNIIMPNAGIKIPLVQLYGLTSLPTTSRFARPYDILFNAQQGSDLTEIYGCILTTVKGGIFDINTGYGHLINPDTLRCIRNTYATGIGLWKNSLLPRISIGTVDGKENDEITTQLTGEVSSLVKDAHDAGLVVHAYTLRPEKTFLPLNPNGTPQTLMEEVKQLVKIGVDGFFCDDPRTCRQVIDSLIA